MNASLVRRVEASIPAIDASIRLNDSPKAAVTDPFPLSGAFVARDDALFVPSDASIAIDGATRSKSDAIVVFDDAITGMNDAFFALDDAF